MQQLTARTLVAHVCGFTRVADEPGILQLVGTVGEKLLQAQPARSDLYRTSARGFYDVASRRAWGCAGEYA